MATMPMDHDVVVVGGGIHGVGVAQAAAARGHRTLLVEKQHLAAGTSSRSSKLIHGGLRYLETAQIGLVRESLRERRILLRNAPELVHTVPFHIPVYDDSSRGRWWIRAGLSLYALLAGPGNHATFSSLGRDQWARLDGLTTTGLRAVFRYWDAQTDDAALTGAVMASARELGAEVACPAELLAAERVDGGYQLRLATGSGDETLRCRVLVNAAGPWIQQVLARLTPTVGPHPIALVQGTHLLLQGHMEHGVYYVEARSDRRAVFVMPYQGQTLLGTTETEYHGDPAAVTPLPEETEYLLETLGHYFPARSTHIVRSFAGLRVLPTGDGSLAGRARETTLLVDDEREPHLLTIAGGKLTGYRATAEKVLARLARVLPAPSRDLDTAGLRLPVTEAAMGASLASD